jgi:PDZ domain
MGNAGASIRAAVRIACGLGCAVALTASVFSAPLCAADGEEPATAEVWSKALAPAASSSEPAAAASAAPAAAESAAPSTAYPLPTTMAAPASDEVHALPVASTPPPANLVTAPAEEIAAPPTTQEIPAITSAAPPAALTPSQSRNSPDGSPTATNNGQFDLDSPDVQRYERAQAGYIDPQQQFGNAAAYTADGAFTSPIGVELAEGSRKLPNGQEAQGLMVLEVTKGSPAATAGLHGYKHTAHTVLQGAVIAAALFPSPFAPIAMLALPVIELTHVGESYDMIIGVDGSRVTNYLDFTDRIHEARPGEIVYLSVLRDGKRAQLKVFLPPSADNTW